MRAAPSSPPYRTPATARRSHFILPLFIHEESSSNQPIPSMPGINRLAYGKNVVDHVAEARSLGVNSVVIFPKVGGLGRRALGSGAVAARLWQRVLRRKPP